MIDSSECLYVLNVVQYKCLSFPVLFQAVSACQLKLESEVSIFLSMVKNEENSGEIPGSPCNFLPSKPNFNEKYF